VSIGNVTAAILWAAIVVSVVYLFWFN